jgi:hypothetical protein
MVMTTMEIIAASPIIPVNAPSSMSDADRAATDPGAS